MEKTNSTKENKKMGLWAAISMAVGTMIGASIFSIFGVGAQIAKQDLPEAFLVSGLFAILVAYSYAKLGKHYVSNAGPIAFILKGTGDNLVTGALSVLMWFTYVVSIAMFAKGFAGYFLPLFHLPTSTTAISITEITVIAFFMILNFFGSKAVGKIEFLIVLIKVAILGIFIALGIVYIKPDYIQPSFEASHVSGLLHASVIFFLSYMGFGLITNASENIRNASRNVPRAIYISIGIVMLIYLLVAVVAVGNLSIPELMKAKENALAIAAKPFLGNAGFLLISIGAVFSISSALNASLYGGANIAYSLAKDGELPEFFERKVWFKSVEGLYITAGLSILIALLFTMNGIASMTSTIFTVIYIFVIISHFRLRKEVGGNAVFLIFNIAIMITILALLLYFQFRDQKMAIVGLLIVFVGAVMLEYGYRYLKNRSFTITKKLKKESNKGKNNNSSKQ
jgi:amino acid transporter